MTGKQNGSDSYYIAELTGQLILGKNRLEDYATDYLERHCKPALEKPMPLPVEQILKKENLKVQEVSLSKNRDIIGCCMLCDGTVSVFDRNTDVYRKEPFPAGTILIDPDSAAGYGDVEKRNVIVHEMLHWEKDRTYFEKQYGEKSAIAPYSPIMCHQSKHIIRGKSRERTTIGFLEWQARTLTPKVLMPFKMFKKKAIEVIEDYKELHNDIPYPCDTLVESLSLFFAVSKRAVKQRLIDVGLEVALSEFTDYDAVFAEIINLKEYVAITPAQAFQLLDSNPKLEEWVKAEGYIYADGYFTRANSEYLSIKEQKFRQTDFAKANLRKCVVNICEQPYYNGFLSDCLQHDSITDVANKRLLIFHPEYQYDPSFLSEEPETKMEEACKAFCEMVLNNNNEEEFAIRKLVGDPEKTLCDCLNCLFSRRHWLPSSFRDNTGLDSSYYYRIHKNNWNNMGKEMLMAICVGLKLNSIQMELLMSKNRYINWNPLEEPDSIYRRIIENIPGISITFFNVILEQRGIKALGTQSRK